MKPSILAVPRFLARNPSSESKNKTMKIDAVPNMACLVLNKIDAIIDTHNESQETLLTDIFRLSNGDKK
jgi:hypothetical protein